MSAISANTMASQLLADLYRIQADRQRALDDAALYHDDPEFIGALLDELSQPHMKRAFVRQCQDIVESSGDAAVNADFARAVRRVAIEFFGEPI